MEPSWKRKALQKQLAHKASLGLSDSGCHDGKYHEHILSDKDATEGSNFYSYNDAEEWANLKRWATKDRKKEINFINNGLKNMLRSEHIAYNVFYPLEKLRIDDPDKLNRLVSSIINIDVSEVKAIRIEYSGEVHKSLLLNDNTSFDAFISFISNGKKCGAGIEIKYTEHSYPYGKTERERLFNSESVYNSTARFNDYFINPEALILKSIKLKQPFRNHLLGIKMEELGLLDAFYSVHFFPDGNLYQDAVAIDYKQQLKDHHKNSFISLTFKEFVDKAKDVGISGKWLKYFEGRYV